MTPVMTKEEEELVPFSPSFLVHFTSLHFHLSSAMEQTEILPVNPTSSPASTTEEPAGKVEFKKKTKGKQGMRKRDLESAQDGDPLGNDDETVVVRPTKKLHSGAGGAGGGAGLTEEAIKVCL